jgi:DNA-binding LytR/AlgR family response regulator
MKTKCFIVESDNTNLKVLTEFISNFPDLEIVGMKSDPIKAIQEISSQDSFYDLIFFDLDVHNLSIIYFLQLIREQTNYVFTTQSDLAEFWAAKNRKINLLKKPFNYEEFECVVSPLLKAPESKRGANYVEGLLSFFIVDFDNKGTFINIKEIIYIQALSNYIKVYMSSGNEYTLHLGLKEIITKLPHILFQRIHKSYIINLSFVNYINGSVIQMKNNIQIPIGPLFRDKLIEYLNSSLLQPLLR